MTIIENPPQPSRAVQRSGAATPEPVALTMEAKISPDIVTMSEPRGERAEAVRALRTHVMAQHVSQGRRAIAICAPSAKVGCTFVATNLAVALSQIGVKTLLIDADLRQPGVDRMIQPARPMPGLGQALSSADVRISECILPDVMPDLSVMFSGGAMANPQELLAGDRFQDLMEYCLREYDVTILDTPPANTCSDARRISTVVGYSVVVARCNKTFADDVKTLVAQLQDDHARVIGTVLNEG
jgi:capsular exopolysaccharide synthesis family protein